MSMVFLVQGRKVEYEYWCNELNGRDFIFATWDKEIKGALFIPNTTWAEGRAILYSQAKKYFPNFLSVTFIDGDARIESGNLSEYLAFWHKNSDLDVLVPWCDKINRFSFVKSIAASGGIFDTDELFQTFSRRYLKSEFSDRSPFVTTYDDKSWWYACFIMQAKIRNIGTSRGRIFSKLEVKNTVHGDNYSRKIDWFEFESIMKKEHLKIRFPLSVYCQQAPWYSRLFLFIDFLYVFVKYNRGRLG